jgi:hypothetical protein
MNLPARRFPCILHCTSEPYRFFGREPELALLDEALAGGEPSVVALVGPGGQGKTAIVQHWLEPFLTGRRSADGVFLWSFYRGKDPDLCLRQLYAYANGSEAGDVSASYCVDHLLPQLRRECWAVVLDGTEVVQHDSGPWFGRFIHPEMSRLLEELASAPMPGVVLLTSRFPFPELERRRHAKVLSLAGLDAASARGLLRSLDVHGSDTELEAAALSCGCHAKAVELLGTYLRRFRAGEAHRHRDLPLPVGGEDLSTEEQHVGRVLTAFQEALPAETQDVLALATAFREPAAEARLREYLCSSSVRELLHHTWKRAYLPFAERPVGWVAGQIQELIDLRLLERVHGGVGGSEVLDAHPLVRRGFEHVLGPSGQRQSALARAGFLRGRPDRRRPATLEQAREEVELFHAYCDAGLWNEADSAFVALDNPKHRFLAPALERDLLLRFFPGGDWRQPPLWLGFGRYRSLAICLEMLGQFDDALAAYRETDAALRGDALLALGRLDPLLAQAQAAAPWQTLWQAYRAHALVLAGRTAEAVALARSLVPVDVYEWIHLFEALLRAGQLAVLDLRSVLYRPPHTAEHRWSDLARQRMQADYRRVTGAAPQPELGDLYRSIMEALDQGGLHYERCLCRLGHARWLLSVGRGAEARVVNAVTLEVARRHGMRIVLADALRVEMEAAPSEEAAQEWKQVCQKAGYVGPERP